jgi:DNA-binding NarL/FixJ family response regulator
MKIYIADSSPLYCSGTELLLEQLLEQVGITATVSSFNHFEALEKALKQGHNSVMMIVDARLPGLESVEQLTMLLAERSARILMVSEDKDLALMRRLLVSGARGAVAKTASLDELKQAIKAVLEGRFWRYEQESVGQLVDQTRLSYALLRLSKQENKVLRFVRTGLRNKQIALEMSLTEHTIKTHMSSILRKLEIENRTQLVVAIKNIQLVKPQLATA